MTVTHMDSSVRCFLVLGIQGVSSNGVRRAWVQPESVGSILALSHKFFNASKSTGETKGSPLWVFFGTMRLFFRKFSKFIKGYPLAFFEVFGL